MDNKQQQGVGMRTREEILADLRRTAKELHAGIDETRATLALEMVEQIRDEIQQDRASHQKKFDELTRIAEEAISLMRDLFVAEYGGEAQTASAKRSVLVKHGLIKGEGNTK